MHIRRAVVVFHYSLFMIHFSLSATEPPPVKWDGEAKGRSVAAGWDCGFFVCATNECFEFRPLGIIHVGFRGHDDVGGDQSKMDAAAITSTVPPRRRSRPFCRGCAIARAVTACTC